jgi:hypothetical protein
MKILEVFFINFIILTMLCSCTNKQIRITDNKIELQKFLTKDQIAQSLIRDTGLQKSKFNEKYLWVQYVNMDEDPQLELLVSYRDQIHNGFYLIYDYIKDKYVNVFMRQWAIEKMSGREAVVASGNQQVHQLNAYIVHLEQAKVYLMWNAIIDKYDYTNPNSGIEIHGNYYVDTNGVLHYYYKTEKTNAKGEVLESNLNEKLFIWDRASNKYKESVFLQSNEKIIKPDSKERYFLPRNYFSFLIKYNL